MYARLVELITADGKSGGVAWSLYASPDGSALFFSGQTEQGSADLVKAGVAFEAGRWYLIALTYGPKWSALYVNGDLVGEGADLNCTRQPKHR